jgi:hypothetical protein
MVVRRFLTAYMVDRILCTVGRMRLKFSDATASHAKNCVGQASVHAHDSYSSRTHMVIGEEQNKKTIGYHNPHYVLPCP